MAKEFSEDQEKAIDYLVLCGRHEGVAYRDGKNAERAVQIVLDEDKEHGHNAHQLCKTGETRRMYIGKRMRDEAARRIRELWD